MCTVSTVIIAVSLHRPTHDADLLSTTTTIFSFSITVSHFLFLSAYYYAGHLQAVSDVVLRRLITTRDNLFEGRLFCPEAENNTRARNVYAPKL